LVLDDAERTPAKVVPGALKDDTLRLLPLLLGATVLSTTELLLSGTGTDTSMADETVLGLGRVLNDVTSADKEIASCEEELTELTVDRGTIPDVLLPEAPVVLEVSAG
jgi:hypothetical protein